MDKRWSGEGEERAPVDVVVIDNVPSAFVERPDRASGRPVPRSAMQEPSAPAGVDLLVAYAERRPETIRALPAPGVNTLSWPSDHRTR